MSKKKAPATLPKTRLVGALDSAGQGIVIEQPMPKLARGHVAVRVVASTISAGTHLGLAKQLRADNSQPGGKEVPLGYQSAGEVVAVGPGVKKFAPGDRVACFGGTAVHSQWNVVPQNLCGLLPEGVDFDDASSINLVLTAIQAIRRAEPVLGEYMLIVGMGLVGQLAAQMAKLNGNYVMGWDTVPGRLRTAVRCGIDATTNVLKDDAQQLANDLTDGHGFDSAIMAIGGDGTKALNQVKEVMKLSPDGHRMGRIVMVGGLITQSQWGAGMGNLDIRSSARTGPGYHDPKWEVGQFDYPPVFMRWTTESNMKLGLRWIAEGKLQMKKLTTQTMPLSQFSEAVDLLIDKPHKALGVVLRMD